MIYSNNVQFKMQRMCFGVSFMLLLFMVACDKEENQEPAIVQSITEVLVGEWALVRLTGGFAGVDENYTVQNSPQTLVFQNDTASIVEVRTDTTITMSNYVVQDVTTSNDTTFFSFSSFQDTNKNFFLSGRPLFMVDNRILQSEIICCDAFEYRFEKQ